MPVFWLPPFNIQLCCDSPSPLLLLSNFGVTYSWYWFLVILFYCFLSSLLVIINVLFISVPAYYHSDTPRESLFANRWLVEPRLGVDHLLLLNSWGRKTVDGCVFAVITTPASEMVLARISDRLCSLRGSYLLLHHCAMWALSVLPRDVQVSANFSVRTHSTVTHEQNLSLFFLSVEHSSYMSWGLIYPIKSQGSPLVQWFSTCGSDKPFTGVI